MLKRDLMGSTILQPGYASAEVPGLPSNCRLVIGGLPAAVLLCKVGTVLPHSWASSSSEFLHSGAFLGCRLLDQVQKLLSPANTLHHDCHHLDHTINQQ